MNHVWQRLAATVVIIAAAIVLGITGVCSGDAAVSIVSAAAGFWFGQFVPEPTE